MRLQNSYTDVTTKKLSIKKTENVIYVHFKLIRTSMRKSVFELSNKTA